MNWFRVDNSWMPWMAQDAVCEHVLANVKTFFRCDVELDSFGIVGSNAVCNRCHLAAHRVIQSFDLVSCHDCGNPTLTAWEVSDLLEARGLAATESVNDDYALPVLVMVRWHSPELWSDPDCPQGEPGFTDTEEPITRGFNWKWYDFYAAQGDEPLRICYACQKLAKHKTRVRRDREDYNAEFPNDDGMGSDY